MIQKIVTNWYVKVEHPIHWREARFLGEEKFAKQAKSECDRIIKEIKRHCDIGYISAEAELEYRCSFCKQVVADENDYECCDASVEEHDRLAAGNQKNGNYRFGKNASESKGPIQDH